MPSLEAYTDVCWLLDNAKLNHAIRFVMEDGGIDIVEATEWVVGFIEGPYAELCQLLGCACGGWKRA